MVINNKNNFQRTGFRKKIKSSVSHLANQCHKISKEQINKSISKGMKKIIYSSGNWIGV